MTDFINRLDGSKLVIFWSFFIAMIAMLIIGWHLIAADGPSASSEIQFLEGVVQAVLVTGGGISTVHVVTGAVLTNKANKQQPPAAPPGGAAMP